MTQVLKNYTVLITSTEKKLFVVVRENKTGYTIETLTYPINWVYKVQSGFNRMVQKYESL